MALTDASIRRAAPRSKPYKRFDGRGLYLLVHPRGGKYWRFKYRFANKEKTLALGVYPDVSLKRAREKLQAARTLLADGIDPNEARRAARARLEAVHDHTFEAVAREWLEAVHRKRVVPKHAERNRRRLERYLFPRLGRRPVAAVTAPELLASLRPIVDAGRCSTAHRVKHLAGQVFRYAIATGRAERDLSADLRGALPPARSRSYPAILDPREVARLLRALDTCAGAFTTRCALRLAPYVFLRPGELRAAEWREIDLQAGRWTLPAHRMKRRRDHLVPLARQVVAILRELHAVTGRRRYVFPGLRSVHRPMAAGTLNAALRRLGFTRETMTAHGFRALASTHLHEQGWSPDVIEHQLAHAERSRVRAAYQRGEYLAERQRMMQAWADYLDALRDGADVVAVPS